MKSKVFLLIFLVVILSSCSVKTNDIEKNKNGFEKTENTEKTEEELNRKKEYTSFLDQITQIINDIKIESEIKENIELSDIKRIQDTYYVVVKVNTDEMSDQYYMLWKYNSSVELLLKGNVIEILTLDNYYFINHRGSLKNGTKNSITKYDHNDENYEKIIYEGDLSKFSFSPNNDYMCIQNSNEIIILDKNYEVLFKNKFYNNAENIDDGNYVDMQFISWSKDNNKLWIATGYHAYVMAIHLIDIKNSFLDTFYNGERYGITEIELNPNNNCIVYSTHPEFYESGAYDEFMKNETKVYLYLLNLKTDEKIEISTSITKAFRPKWIDNKRFEYNDPQGLTRLTFNIDDYYSDNSSKDNNQESLWKDAKGITPIVNGLNGNWYYNENTYEINLKIPSIYDVMSSQDVYFYYRDDNKGCYISITDFIYETDNDLTFNENVKKIYLLNNNYPNESLFDNEKIEEGITDNGYKYVYFKDEFSDSSDGRILSYIFVQLDDNVICKLAYSLFSEDFDKFDSKILINSVTHTLTTGLWRDEFLILYDDDQSGEVIKQINFKIPYVYSKTINPYGRYYYTDFNKQEVHYRLKYWVDDKEEFTIYINEGTEIEYMGKLAEGYTKNGYKYSYYVEEENVTNYNKEEDRFEDIPSFVTNIAVRFDENIVLKISYQLSSEKDYSLFDKNVVLDSIDILQY